MERTYDLFEIESGGVVRCTVIGHKHAIMKLYELAQTTDNEVRVLHIPTHSIVAVINAKEKTSPRFNVVSSEAPKEKLLEPPSRVGGKYARHANREARKKNRTLKLFHFSRE